MIVGVLSWFDESASWLSACVASMARVCDHVVAVDGRYEHFDHPLNASPVEQTEAVVETAAGAGLALTLHRPVQPLFGEVEKRNLTLKLAACVATPMRDWLLVLDGDCYITEHSPLIRKDLEQTSHHAAQILVEEHLESDAATSFNIPTTTRTPMTLLYRLLPGMEYRGTHYSLGGYVDGQWVWLWGHGQTVEPAMLPSKLVVRHRNALRTVNRKRAAAEYYERRDALGLESRPA